MDVLLRREKVLESLQRLGLYWHHIMQQGDSVSSVKFVFGGEVRF